MDIQFENISFERIGGFYDYAILNSQIKNKTTLVYAT